MFEEDFDRKSDKADRRNSRNRKFGNSYDKPDRIRLAKIFDARRERKQTKQQLNEIY
jgi:hypothetical protein